MRSGAHSARAHHKAPPGPGYGEEALYNHRPSTSSPRVRHDKEMLDALNTISQSSSIYASPPSRGTRGHSANANAKETTSYFLPALDVNGNLKEIELPSPGTAFSASFVLANPNGGDGVSPPSQSPYLAGGQGELRKRIATLEMEIGRLRLTLDKKVKTIRKLEEREVSRQYEDDLTKTRLQRAWEAELERVKAEWEERHRLGLAGERSNALRGVDGVKLSMEEQAAAREAKEKEERIELLRRQIARRMKNTGITRGWTAWHEMWSAKVRNQQMLRQAASRLLKPLLSEGFRFWQRDWEEKQRKEAEKQRLDYENSLLSDKDKLELELQKMRDECDRKLVSAAKIHQQEMTELRISLAGSAEEQNALREAKEKEERIELLRRQVTRRIMNADISRGWTAWFELWEAQTYSKQMLRQASMRLAKPALSGGFSFWKDDWVHETRAAELAKRKEIEEGLQVMSF